ncbi:MAG TPA: 4Fe-4S binding protein [Ruminiclostridium sp.]|nr:4Fe-4S binding protein [Ruminiclostridium sp.]
MSRASVKTNFSGGIPKGTYGPAMHLTETLEGWRNSRPVIDNSICSNCGLCYLVCPEGVIFNEENKMSIDYRFCKGCGICAKECRKQAITMEEEGIANEQ